MITGLRAALADPRRLFVREPADAEFFLPDLCTTERVFYLVLVAELLVLVLVLADSGLRTFSWSQLGLVSLFVQWVALSSAGILCRLRASLGLLGNPAATAAAVLVVMLVTLAFSLAGGEIMSWLDETHPAGGGLWILRNELICLVMTGLVFRHLYLQQQLRQQEQAELNARIQALHSRIRPHFLFNSMNIIASLIPVDPELAEEVVEDLSALFRASLSDTQGSPVPLREELDLCQRYVRIESLRMDDRLRVDWSLALDPDTVRIPLLTLQPLLENAIYHGIQPLPEGGLIQIEGSVQGEDVVLRVTNPLVAGVAGHARGNRMALENIRQRLSALHGDAASVTVRNQGDRFETEIRFPK